MFQIALIHGRTADSMGRKCTYYILVLSLSGTGMQKYNNRGHTFLKLKDLENIRVNAFV